MDKTHKMNWKWQNMKFKIRKVKFEGKWNHSVKQAERLWLSIIISKTGGINYSFGPDANKNNKNLQMILQCCNNLGSQRAAAQQEMFCTFDTVLSSCAYRALLCHFLWGRLSFGHLCYDLCAGNRTTEVMFFTPVIYGPDSRRKLASFSPSQAQIGKYQCS